MAKKTNFEVNGNKYFRVTRTVGKKADGTPIRKTFYGTGINEANEKANDYMNKLKTGLVNNFEYVTIGESMYQWLFQIKRNELKPSSFQSYEGTYRNYIKDSEIAGLKVFSTKSIQIQEYYNKLGKDKTFSQIKKLNKLLKQFFFYAEKEGYCIKNPCTNITIPNQNASKIKKEDKIEYFNEEEIKLLKKAFKGNKFENLVLIALGTGLRQGELLALKWENINLDKGYLKVAETVKTVYLFDYEGNKKRATVYNAPKSNESRIVSLPQKLIEILSGMNHNTTFVFEDEEGNPYSAKTLFGNWKKVLTDNNIPYKKFHSLRHTYGTMLLSKGVDLNTVKELMGHADIKTTEIYLHSLPQQKKNSVNKLNSLL